jgi:hypothetical protein
LCIAAYVVFFAMGRYKQMPNSKGKPCVLQHYWKLLENSEKLKLREQEAPTKKGSMVKLDDDDSDVERGEGTRASLMEIRRERKSKEEN